MFKNTKAFSGFSVNDQAKAKQFYTETLGLHISDESEMGFSLHVGDDTKIFVYPKENHEPASFTILNFVVDDIDQTVQALKEKDITLEQYEGMNQDSDGIARGLEHDMGPNIGWFKDPAGNIFAILQEK